jgi:hypothetical protein
MRLISDTALSVITNRRKTMTDNKDCVVQYGNVWLQTDDITTKINWVDERAEASYHTREWAERFQERMRLESKRVHILTVEEAMKQARDRCQQQLRAAYFYAVEAEVRRLHPNVSFHIKGVGCAAWCFIVDINFAKGVPVEKAVRKFLKEYKRTHPGKFKKAKV